MPRLRAERAETERARLGRRIHDYRGPHEPDPICARYSDGRTLAWNI
jgi:hypothetical protein